MSNLLILTMFRYILKRRLYLSPLNRGFCTQHKSPLSNINSLPGVLYLNERLEKLKTLENQDAPHVQQQILEIQKEIESLKNSNHQILDDILKLKSQDPEGFQENILFKNDLIRKSANDALVRQRSNVIEDEYRQHIHCPKNRGFWQEFCDFGIFHIVFTLPVTVLVGVFGLITYGSIRCNYEDQQLQSGIKSGNVEVVKKYFPSYLTKEGQCYSEAEEYIRLVAKENKVELLKLIMSTRCKDETLAEIIKSGDFATARVLIFNLKSQHNYRTYRYAWPAALLSGKLDIIESIVNAGINVKTQDNLGIIEMSSQGNIPAMELLISRGAVVNARGNMPVIQASTNGHIQAVKLLCNNGANPRADNDEPILAAARNGHEDVVKLLISLGAPFKIETKRDGVIILNRTKH